MNYKREWANLKNEFEFEAECTRLALPFYERELLLAKAIQKTAIKAVKTAKNAWDIADKAFGPASSNDDLSIVKATFSDANRAIVEARQDLYIANRALTKAKGAITRYATQTRGVIARAIKAGVDAHDMDVAFARWIVRDISPRWPIDEATRQAAGAAIVAGDEDLAREILA
ncbi:hypothetical protein LCGC14_1422170 [marine sediment metagenome]|uniref:Uncharacterized protein n=1 Tax=marine sediment metagenome TaxID=412755 RepID=A0A0F9JQW7_9ZZZZ